MSKIEQSVRLELLSGVKSSQELLTATETSQATVSRALSGLGDTVVRIGKSRSSRYGLRAEIPNLGSSWPLFLIGEDGSPSQLGRLHSLARSACWIERASPQAWTSLFGKDFKDGVFPGLPWFLDDARPQGFLGRVFARRHGADLREGTNPILWSNESVLESLIRFGHNLPGAFVLGKYALTKALSGESENVVESSKRETEYPRLASSVLNGNVIGSSAGGEQPKFTARLSSQRHVLVKFSLDRDRPEGGRWADLLSCEKIALDVLAENGFQCPKVDVFDFGNRRFLEVERFDRTPAGGRIPTVSLRALDSAFLGMGSSPWDVVASEACQHAWLDQNNSEKLSSQWRFGQLIGNSDMHFGNVSFVLFPRRPLTLAPVYDMLPMIYRPGIEGDIPGRQNIPSQVSELNLNEHGMAKIFWERVSEEPSISDPFREIAAGHARELKSA